METINISTSQHIDIDYPVAGLGERIAARLIDLAVFLGLYLIFILLTVLTGISGAMDGAPYLLYVLLFLYLGSYVFYNLICEIFMNGQSVGKRMMKIKVISLDGGQATMGQYAIRWIFRLVDFVLSFQLAGLFCIAISEKNQRVGDMVAGTTVISTLPRTNFDHIAFKPVQEDYTPVFPVVNSITDSDVELVHEVLNRYRITNNPEVIYQTAAKVAEHLNVTLPEGMNELVFLQTIIKDYNHITSEAI